MSREYFISRRDISNNALEREKLSKSNWSLPSDRILFKRVSSNGALSVVMVTIDGFELKTEVIKKSLLDNIGVDITVLPDYSLFKEIKNSLSEWFNSNVTLKMINAFSLARNMHDKHFEARLEKAYLLRREVYEEYLSSEEWQEKRSQCFAFHGSRCIDCGSAATDVHHQSYDNLCDEDIERDLVPLCATCHKVRHDNNDYYGRLNESFISTASRFKRFNHKSHGWLQIISFDQFNKITMRPTIEFYPPNGKFKSILPISSSDILEFSN